MRLTFAFWLPAIASVGLTVAAAFTYRLPGDLAIIHWIQKDQPGHLIKLFTDAVGWINEPLIVVFGAIAGCLLLIRRRWITAFGLLAVLIAIAPVSTIKQLVGRPRPPADLVNVLTSSDSLSFPSGHVFLATVIFGSMIFYADKIVGPNRLFVAAFRAVLIFITLDIGFSRLYKGVHWPSDVLGGYLLGSVGLWLMIWVYERFIASYFSKVLVRMNLASFAQKSSV